MVFEFTPSQKILAKETSRNIVVNAGRRFGKSTWVAFEMVGCALSGKNKIVQYFAPTFDTARTIMWRVIREIAKPSILSSNETRLELKIKTVEGGTSTISLFGWDRADNRRGVGLDLVCFDEVAFMKNFNYFWLTVFKPALLDKKGRAIFTSTPNGFNDFFELSENAKNTPDWAYYHFTSYDNPRNDVEELEKIKKEYFENGKENSFFQEYMAEFRKSEGLVYKNFSESLHLINEEPQVGNYSSIYMGVDWGYVDPTVALLIGRRNNGLLEVIDEYVAYETEKIKTIEFLKSWAAKWNINRTYPDCADRDGFSMLKNAGLNPFEVDKSKGSVFSGIESVRSALSNNRLKINSRCPFLIKSFQNYSYKKNSKNEEPDHFFSDSLDALRYAIHSLIPAKNEVNNVNENKKITLENVILRNITQSKYNNITSKLTPLE